MIIHDTTGMTLKRDLSNISWVNVINEQSLNSAWNLFKNILSATILKHVPLKEKLVRGEDCPWMTSKIRQEIRNRDYYLKKARKMNAEIDWSTYRRLQNSATAQIRNAKANYQRNILKEETNNPKKFWRQIRKCYPSGSKNRMCSKSFTVEGKKITDKKRLQMVSVRSLPMLPRISKMKLLVSPAVFGRIEVT